MAKKGIPEGYHTVTPYLSVKNAGAALDFYRKALGAEEICRFAMPDGRVGHAQIRVGDSNIMLADEFPEMKCIGPQTLGGTSVRLYLYVEDADSAFARAIGAGGTELSAVSDQFYGDRAGCFQDPFGHVWTLATNKESLTEEELKMRMSNLPKG